MLLYCFETRTLGSTSYLGDIYDQKEREEICKKNNGKETS